MHVVVSMFGLMQFERVIVSGAGLNAHRGRDELAHMPVSLSYLFASAIFGLSCRSPGQAPLRWQLRATAL